MAFNVGAAPAGILARALTGNIFVEKNLAFMNEGDRDGYNAYKHDIKNVLRARSANPAASVSNTSQKQAFKRSLVVVESFETFDPVDYHQHWREYQPEGEFQWEGLPAEVQTTLEELFLGTSVEATEDELTNGDGTLLTGLIPQLESASYTNLTTPAIAASGTVTAATAIAGNTVTVNGLVYTAVAGAKANNTEFSIDTGDDETAADLADSIQNDTRTGITVPSVDLLAAAVGAVVTITADTAGVIGNSIDLASSGATLAVSAAALAGGAQSVVAEATPTQVVNNTAISFRAHGGGSEETLSEILTSDNIFDKMELMIKHQTKAMRKRANRKYMVSHGTADLIREAQRLKLNFKGVDVTEEGVMRYAGYDIIENPSFPSDTILFCSMSGDMKTDAIQLGTSLSADFNNLEVERLSNFGREWGMCLTFALDIFVVRPEEVCFYTPNTVA